MLRQILLFCELQWTRQITKQNRGGLPANKSRLGNNSRPPLHKYPETGFPVSIRMIEIRHNHQKEIS